MRPDWRFCDPASGTRVAGGYLPWLVVVPVTFAACVGWAAILRAQEPIWRGVAVRLTVDEFMLLLSAVCAGWSAVSTSGALASQRQAGTLQQLLLTRLSSWALVARPVVRGAGPVILGVFLSLPPAFALGGLPGGLRLGGAHVVALLQTAAFAFGGGAVGLHASAASRTRLSALGVALGLCGALLLIGAVIPLFVLETFAWVRPPDTMYAVFRGVDLIYFFAPIVLGLTALYCAKVRLDIEPELHRQ